MPETNKRPSRPIRRTWWRPFAPRDISDSNMTDMRNAKSLIASAARLVSEKVKGARRRTESWMIEAWTMYDIVGELHYLSTTLSRRASKARFYVGRVTGNAVEELEAPDALGAPMDGEPVESTLSKAEVAEQKKARRVFASLGDGFIGLQEIVERGFLNQFIVGASYVVGAPAEVWNPTPAKPPRAIKAVPINELVWRTLSVTEFVPKGENFELVQTGATASGKSSVPIHGNTVYVIALWTPHPADSSVPDSPVRASLPVLRELVGLTQHISAQVDSRLAGAGMLVMRSSHSRALKRAMNIPEDDARDPFTELLIEAMVTPISDRDSASAVVPFVTTIPDDSEAPEFISFSAPLDQHAPKLREESIRRLALSLDAPPELLLGQGDTSHWTAWLTAEEVVDSHISPTLALIARGLTTEFLRPILRANGLSVEAAERYAIWFDVSALTVKANMGADAQALYALDLLSDEAVRRANGFDETDAPKKADIQDQAVDLVRDMVVANPGLMNRPGLDSLLEQMTALMSGKPLPSLTSGKSASKPAAEDEAPDEEKKVVDVIAPKDTAPSAKPTPITVGGSSSGPRPPVTTTSKPGIPKTAKPAAGDTKKFGK